MGIYVITGASSVAQVTENMGALVALERDRARAERERQKRAFTSSGDGDDSSFTGDLLAAGVALVWALMKD